MYRRPAQTLTYEPAHSCTHTPAQDSHSLSSIAPARSVTPSPPGLISSNTRQLSVPVPSVTVPLRTHMALRVLLTLPYSRSPRHSSARLPAPAVFFAVQHARSSPVLRSYTPPNTEQASSAWVASRPAIDSPYSSARSASSRSSAPFCSGSPARFTAPLFKQTHP